MTGEFDPTMAPTIQEPQAVPSLFQRLHDNVALRFAGGALALGGLGVGAEFATSSASAAPEHVAASETPMTPSQVVRRIKNTERGKVFDGNMTINVSHASLTGSKLLLDGRCAKNAGYGASFREVTDNGNLAKHADCPNGSLAKYYHEPFKLKTTLVSIGNKVASSLNVTRAEHNNAAKVLASKAKAEVFYAKGTAQTEPRQLKEVILYAPKKNGHEKVVEKWYPATVPSPSPSPTPTSVS